MSNAARKWICCQLGAREHYMVPAALRRRGELSRLLTEFWVSPDHPLRAIAPRLRDRFHPELDGAVTAFNGPALAFEAQALLGAESGWPLMMRRNAWFQTKALDWLTCNLQPNAVVLSYSYAARRLFEIAKSRGCTTVLVQIDPGPAEERIVEQLQHEHPAVEPAWQPAPAEYWQQWRNEIDLADHVVVHSQWSRTALTGSGIPQRKLTVIPLAYEPPGAAQSFTREYPRRFTQERPLRVLFLGQVILRKGVMPLLDAARELQDQPIEFIIAGPNALSAEQRRAPGRLRWTGAVPRSQAGLAYRNADVFLFPTLSDGFGLTQLEAQAWRLPVIATSRCGEVVRDGVNGILLREISGREIAGVLGDLVANPEKLAAMSLASGVDERHRPDRFAESLSRIEREAEAHAI